MIIKIICSSKTLVLGNAWLGTKMYVEILLTLREKPVLIVPLHNVVFYTWRW
jgi:hypothetical protein